MARLGPQRLDAVGVQGVQDLLAAAAAGSLRQHGQGHVEVQRGAGGILAAAAGQQQRDALPEIIGQGIGVTLRLVILRLLALLPFSVTVPVKGKLHHDRIFRRGHLARQQLQ